MPKEILLYGGVNEFSATQFVKELDAAKDEDVVIRVNSQGGSPEDMFSMIGKLKEHTKSVLIKVDGAAYSAGLFFLNYTDTSEALDVSRGVLHRAAYPTWFEQSDLMTEARWEQLNSLNKDLRKGFENKIDIEKYNALGKPSLDEVFSNDSRIDVNLTAKEMKKIGLISKIVAITPEKRAEIDTMVVKMAASFKAELQEEEPLINNKMTKDEFKTKHPELYKEITDAAAAQAKSEELDRINSIITFVDVDPDKVKAVVSSGKNLSQAELVELTTKKVTANIKAENAAAKLLEEKEKGSATVVSTEEEPVVELTAEQKVLADFEAKIDQNLGFSKK